MDRTQRARKSLHADRSDRQCDRPRASLAVWHRQGCEPAGAALHGCGRRGMRQHAPQIEIAGNATAVAERAAARVVARLRDRHAVTLRFATGATMRPVYARLVAAARAGDVSFRAVSSFNLHEYVGLSPPSPRRL